MSSMKTPAGTRAPEQGASASLPSAAACRESLCGASWTLLSVQAAVLVNATFKDSLIFLCDKLQPSETVD